MKRIIRLLSVCLLLGAALLCASCTDTPDPTPKTTLVKIVDAGASDYVIVYGKNDLAFATKIQGTVSRLTGIKLDKVLDTSAEPVAHEIVVGNTNRPNSAVLKEAVLGYLTEDDNNFGFKMAEESLYIYVENELAWEKCLTYFENMYFSDDTLMMRSPSTSLESYTKAEYDAYLAEQKKIEDEKVKAQQAKEVLNLKAKLAALDIEDFGGSQITTDLGGHWEEPEAYPTVGQHPRLLVTAEDLPALRAAAADTENNSWLINDYLKRSDEECTGILGPKTTHDFFPGNYNWDGEILVTIQAKAFRYLLTGNEYYGYQALLAICNYMKTLDIGYFQDDQWRRYGYTMYTAALVYDWCYDLMDDDLKLLMTSGVEHKLASGKSSEPSKAHWDGVKMEMGFPPIMEGGYVVGHSAELQFMCFYTSYALAVYDEVPGWWEMIGGRLYEEYVPIRQQIYATGMFPQGTAEYAQMRYIADLYCAWLLKSAVGSHPYSDEEMATIMHSFMAHEAGGNGYFFVTGDGNNARMAEIAFDALISSYLSGDVTNRTYVLENFNTMVAQTASTWHTWMSTTDMLICMSRKIEPADDWRSIMDAVSYNDGYYAQIIARNEWAGEDSVVVLLHGGGKTSGGHDHASNGNFEIYYKGILTGDAGVYDGWGTLHHYHYHQATIAHNSLLIYNPNMATTCGGYYTGGQKEVGTGSYTIKGDWLSTDTTTIRGVNLGEQHGYYDTENKQTKYVYYANDITKAYDAATVSYVARSIVTTFPEDDTVPMIMFVCDRIDAKNANFRKTFLLQCASEPEISGNTVTIDNGKNKGRLVLVSLQGNDGSVTAYGGSNRYYLVEKGTTLPNKGTTRSDSMWGRVEICPAKGNLSDNLLQVLYVTKGASAKTVTATKLTSGDFLGANALNQTAYFNTAKTYKADAFTLPAAGTGNVNYYVGGLEAGTWTVSAGGTAVATVTVTAEGHVATFTYAGTGTLSFTPSK